MNNALAAKQFTVTEGAAAAAAVALVRRNASDSVYPPRMPQLWQLRHRSIIGIERELQSRPVLESRQG
ncbi:hypothetical protein [Tsukamurella soli]|uniref:Uncharacterized protein n=1 Tax=Tsukamurella soli TaxID=644556 RepID=A0ABP8JKJ7_9ACTN